MTWPRVMFPDSSWPIRVSRLPIGSHITLAVITPHSVATKAAISPSTGRTLPDRYIEGTCPICGYGEARGDQCDNCGNQLDATDLINPRSKINGETPTFVETQHWFLDLPALVDLSRRSDAEWAVVLKGSPMRRAKIAGLRRNVEVALRNGR